MDARLAIAVLLLASASIAQDCSFEPHHVKNMRSTMDTPLMYELSHDGRNVPDFEIHGIPEGVIPKHLVPSNDLNISPTFKRGQMKALSMNLPMTIDETRHKYFMKILIEDKLEHPAVAYGFMFKSSDNQFKRIVVVFEPVPGTIYKDHIGTTDIKVWDVVDYHGSHILHGEDPATFMMTSASASINRKGCAPEIKAQTAEMLGSSNGDMPQPRECTKDSDCNSGEYCGTLNEEAKEHAPPGMDVPDNVCMPNGFKPGSCSMEYINCNKYANCTESDDGMGYLCQCPDDATGDGFSAGTGCTLMYKVCVDNFDCPEYGRCRDDFICECKEGFEGDPRYKCTDIIDCPSDKCDVNAICKDHPGTFSCTCNIDAGFYGDGSVGSCKFQCHGDQDCHSDAFCNSDHLCQCRAGFEGNGHECHDVAECSNGNSNCHEHADCFEEKGGYKCVCRNGYEGDGFTCTAIPRDCNEILAKLGGLSLGAEYWIDPDFTGPAGKMRISCSARPDGNIITRVKPTPNEFPVTADNKVLNIPYEANPQELKAFVEHFKFCTQEVQLNCLEGFKMFPHTKWYDAYGVGHQNFGSPNQNECACGAVGQCPDGCFCNGKGYADEKALVIDKTQLPIMRFEFSHANQAYNKATIKRTNFLRCAHKQFDIPRDCHEAKFERGMKKNGPLYIDPDGDDGAAPFLAYCDVETYEHVGITVINPKKQQTNGNARIRRSAKLTSDIQYNTNAAQMKALVDNSDFCSQYVEYNCKNSGLLGGLGGRVYGPNGRLNYFPGANGVSGACGCGATKSCDQRGKHCNCDIFDGKMRKDFGLIINKADLPATKVTEQAGAHADSFYSVKGLQCARKQFGIEPNCEKYRASKNIYESYTYFVDPDGPGKQEPFLAECEFDANPPQGKTIIHHEDEEPKAQPDTINFAYLQANLNQIEALKERSTYCSQTIEVGCNKYSLKYNGKSAKWTTADGKSLELSRSMDSCALDGTKCKCNAEWENQKDNIHLTEMSEVPALAMNFGQTKNQGARSELTVKVGPLVCADVFPNCAELKKYVDLARSQEGAEGEEDLPVEGIFTVDPDGPGGVDPFSVTCKFPATIVDIAPDDEDNKVTPPPEKVDPTDPNYDPNNPPKFSQCTPITYYDTLGNKISPEQITALVRSSDECTQDLEIQCKFAKASGNVNFTSCDGVTHQGVSSFGTDTCTCGVTGSCMGGPEEKCNCDDEHKRWGRTDGGTIVATDRLPVCEVCLATEAYPKNVNPKVHKRELSYTLGQLECNGETAATGMTCQEYKKKYGRVRAAGVDVSVVFNKTHPVPIGCRLTQQPPVGEQVTYPVDPVSPPNGTNPVDVKIEYYTINITLTREHMERYEYCTQQLYVFGGGDKNMVLDNNNYWYDFNGNKFQNWQELPAGHADLDAMCKKQQALCNKHGAPRGFRITESQQLPVAGVFLGDVTDVTLVAGESTCLDLLTSCQEVVEHPTKRFSGDVGGSRYVIDPDGPGDVKPFVVNCHLDFPGKNGITEVRLGDPFKNNVPKDVEDAELPLENELDVNYLYVNDPEQIDALTEISDFCWQTVKTVCDQSPLNKDGTKVVAVETLNGGQIPSFGAGNETSIDGCACKAIGSCTDESLQCNCDAGGQAIDQGSIVDKTALPVTKIKVGGQAAGGSANVFVNSIRCSKRPVDPPHDCAEALKWKSRFDINYHMTGDFLISPSPYNPEIKPFMAHCDMDSFPGIGVTVIYPQKDSSKTTDSTPDEDGNIPEGQKGKKKVEKVPGQETTTITEYYTPTDKEVKALVDYSKYCYQFVRFECQNTPIFAEDNRWYTLGDASQTARKYWGGGANDGYCACGLETNCGGLDSASEQRARKCNCDANDGELRSDAGIISDKNILPIGPYVTGANSDFGSVNLTVGPIMCADQPLVFDECALGFHDCHRHAECVDTDKAYKCFCKEGWQGKGTIDNENAPRANGRECIDDDECTWSPCPENSDCLNLPGSFNCTCHTGFRQLGPMECEDIDECAEGSHLCAEFADCKNLQGSHTCRCSEGYRGNGFKECIPIGQCFMFGDPHIISFDNNWVHHQGDCEYVMAQDGCTPDEECTWKITVEHWKDKNVRAGYYSWIKAVHVHLYSFGYSVTLDQNYDIIVNGEKLSQFHHSHILSVARVLEHMRLSVVTGLEVNWDGKDVVEVNVPRGDFGKTCGICGNFNNRSLDDNTMGPACPALEGKLTDNHDLLGTSWTALNTPKGCTVDCDPDNRPNPNVTDDKCNYPLQTITNQCEHVLGLYPQAPFSECMKRLNQYTREQFMFSCVMDGCYEEFDLGGHICKFAKIVNQYCNTNQNVKTPDWRTKISCATVECSSNKVYNACGVPEPKTCVNIIQDHHTDSLAYGDVCVDGCFCPDGLIQEGENCVEEGDCGCFYNFVYLTKNQEILLPNCTGNVVCLGNNVTDVNLKECNGEHRICGKNETTGIPACICKEGYRYNEESGNCETDECFGIVCDVKGAWCENGTCHCPKGLQPDCGVCIDIDECHTAEHKCDWRQGLECVNTEGSYECRCMKGLYPNGTRCDDIDECKENVLQCGEQSQCNNLYGGAECECCAGYKMNDEMECVRDYTIDIPAGSKCCSCVGSRCRREGKVCGTDGRTYTTYRALTTQNCLDASELETEVKVDIAYPGECQATCETVICDKKFSNCEMDTENIPQCSCPTCNNITTMYEEDMVCATNKVTYISLCHLNKDSCEANIETDIQVETIGKPCPEPSPDGEPAPTPEEWGEWGPCSEKCKQGVQVRSRETNGADVYQNQTKTCYNTCPQGPCRPTSCPTPGSVCQVEAGGSTSCGCPACEEPTVPICGRIGNYISTFDSECLMFKEACEQGEPDFEMLEKNRCEDKPKGCARIRNFKFYEDENGCKADREIDMGYCYGGCKEGRENHEMCCYATKVEHKFAIMECPDGTRKNKFVKQIKECNCIKTADVPEPAMNVVN